MTKDEMVQVKVELKERYKDLLQDRNTEIMHIKAALDRLIADRQGIIEQLEKLDEEIKSMTERN